MARPSTVRRRFTAAVAAGALTGLAALGASGGAAVATGAVSTARAYVIIVHHEGLLNGLINDLT